jgi:pyroglutamyl-peptidase
MTHLIRVLVFLASISCAYSAETADSPDASISQFVNTYFSSWSKEDFAQYRACFHPSATVTFQENNEWKQWELNQFLNDQQNAQAQHHLEEVPLHIHVEARHGDIAFVEVPWKLKLLPTPNVITGIDWYVLVKHDQTWQILNLTFWEDPAGTPQTRQEHSKPKIIVSGFEQFAGRSINASSVLAKDISEDFPDSDITYLKVPVVWGAPEEAIIQNRPIRPDVWIAFGEGAKDFQIETLASNRRAKICDNHNRLPETQEIDPGGPQQLKLNISPQALVEQMRKLGYTLKISSDAGGFLCDEMLYSLLREQQDADSTLKQVVFIHVPIYGTKVRIHGQDVAFSGQNVDTAARDLFEALGENLQINNLK